jgi:hypothetical protein
LSRSSSLWNSWRRRILALMERTQAECEEALRTLYRLRAQWRGRKGPPGEALEAIERLIEEYERELGKWA